MNRRNHLYVALGVWLGLGGAALAGPVQIDPADARGIRLYQGELYMLNGLSIHNGVAIHDRTAIEFDISTLPAAIALATLDLGIQNQDPGGPVGVIDVFTYEGDGVIAPEEFYAGDWTLSFPHNGPPGVVSVDVTSIIQDAVDVGQTYVGFRLSTETNDRYFLGAIVGLPDPVLTVIPEPAVATMLAIGSVSLLFRRRR